MSDRHYLILREKLEALLTEGQQFGRRAAEWEKVETYWHLGDELLRFLERQHGFIRVCAQATAHRTRLGGRLKPMVFNFVWTPGASAELGARADGSKAGEMIGHGVTPLSRAMRAGITSAIHSIASLPLECVTGGATTLWTWMMRGSIVIACGRSSPSSSPRVG